MISFKCGPSAVVFANRTKPLGIAVEKNHDAYHCCVRENHNTLNPQRMGRFCEGQNAAVNKRTASVHRTCDTTFRNCVRTFSTSQIRFTVHVDMKKNYFKILGVTPQCSGVKVKQAYYRLSKVYHPDVNKTESAVQRFHEITEAYEVLSNPSLRHQYEINRRGHGHVHGHTHGVRRGVKPGPVNYNARGPHQHVKTDQHNMDEWLKEHYTEAFKQRLVDIRKQRYYEKLERGIEHENRRRLDLIRKKYYKKPMYDDVIERESNMEALRYLGYSVLGMVVIYLIARTS